jgi:hypothetical protein
MRVDVRIV